MYYIGYTSVISNVEDGRILEYADWNFSAEEDEEDVTEYSLARFFTGEEDEEGDYVLTVPADSDRRQLAAQYPSKEVLERASIMVYFDSAASEATNKMWVRVRCYNIKNVPVWAWVLAAAVLAGLVVLLVRARKRFR